MRVQFDENFVSTETRYSRVNPVNRFRAEIARVAREILQATSTTPEEDAKDSVVKEIVVICYRECPAVARMEA